MLPKVENVKLKRRVFWLFMFLFGLAEMHAQVSVSFLSQQVCQDTPIVNAPKYFCSSCSEMGVSMAKINNVGHEEEVTLKEKSSSVGCFNAGLFLLSLFFLSLFLWTVYRLRTIRMRVQKHLLINRVADQTTRLKNNNVALKVRAQELDRINQILEERQKLITEQAEELESQAENLQKSNQELLRHIKTKDKLFSIIAHDLRAPFNTIMGFSSLLTEVSEQDDKEQLRAYARYINDASLLVFNLLENLLYWARSQTNEIQFVPGVFRLDEIVKENVGLVRETAIKKEIRLEDTGYHNYAVFGDVNMMRTVFRNLMINAVKFTDKGGAVTITSSELEEEIEVCISDTGRGMSEEELERVLHSGVGHSQKGTDGEKGSGLGLVLCQEFISRNRGRLKVSSQPGEGSCFSFTLPKKA